MKILFVTSTLNRGGAERVLTTLANYWSQMGHSISIVKLAPEKSQYDLEKNVALVSVKTSPYVNCFSKIKHKLEIIKSLADVIRQKQPSIVISFMDAVNIISIPAAKLAGVKIIASERIHAMYMKSKLWRLLRNLAYRFASGIVVLSKFDYDHYSFIKNRAIIHNPAWLIGSQPNAEQKEKIILSVGRLCEQKGFDVLLKAIASMPQEKMKDWKVLILGEGPLDKDLQAAAAKQGIGDLVSFPGNRHDIIDYYKKSAIFVSTSRAEGFPNALCEALSMGCACIATDCPTGPSELIRHGENGFLVPVDSADSVCEHLIKLLEEKPLRQKFAKNSIEVLKNFSLQSVAEKWEQFIQSILLI